MSRRIIQFCYRLIFGDAISNHMLFLGKVFKENGYNSIMSSKFIDKNLKERDEIIIFENLKICSDDILIYHNSGKYEHALLFRKINCYKILVFHNETPTVFLFDYKKSINDNDNDTKHPSLISNAIRFNITAFQDLKKVLPFFNTAWADSSYNSSCLKKLGFNNVSILPIPYIRKNTNIIASSSIIKKYSDTKNILFVGRIVSNKKQIDIIKAFAYYHKIVPKSRLFLVGDFMFSDDYREEFINYGKTLGLINCIHMPGKVSYEDLEAYWRSASLFLSMSEHEGFCVPVLEALAHEVPVIAFASSAIPETLGNAGILFYEKNFTRIAEVMNAVIENPERVNALKAAGHEQIKKYSQEKLSEIAVGLLDKAVKEVIKCNV